MQAEKQLHLQFQFANVSANTIALTIANIIAFTIATIASVLAFANYNCLNPEVGVIC